MTPAEFRDTVRKRCTFSVSPQTAAMAPASFEDLRHFVNTGTGLDDEQIKSLARNLGGIDYLYDGPQEPTPMTTGTDVIRNAVRVHSRHGGYLARLARDADVGIAALEDFCHGRGNLTAAVLQAVVKHVYQGHARFDETRDLLVSVPAPSAGSLMILPKLDPKTLPGAWNGKSGTPPLYPAVKGAAKKPEPKPGWAAAE